MSCDYIYYYDFSSEVTLSSWQLVSGVAGSDTVLSCEISSPGGDVVFLHPFRDRAGHPGFCPLVSLEVNGTVHDWVREAETAYVMRCGSRWGLRVTLEPGVNVVRVRLREAGAGAEKSFTLNLIPDLPAVEIPHYHGHLEVAEEPLGAAGRSWDLTGYRLGAGGAHAPGRFGFSKGDGVLDCAMPCLGVIDKMYLCGHPRYQKPFRWCYSVLPEGALHHGSYAPATCGIEGDRIEVNQLSVRWGTTFDGHDFSCTYSLGSPGIITESDSGTLYLSKLDYAGNYQYVLIPGQSGIEVLSLDEACQGLDMSENWLLLFGCTEFPDLPLLVVLDRQPQRLEVRRNVTNRRLSSILFHGNHRMVTATPFGFESPDPISPGDVELLSEAVRRCRFWSHVFMAYPVSCEEHFRLDHEAERVDIVQRFSYRYLTDAWGTSPLELAPLPPVLSMSGIAEYDDVPVDVHFPTKYGDLYVSYGRMSQYRLPFMPLERKFPLKDAEHGEEISSLLQDGLQEYFSFLSSFRDDWNAYPYAGALVEPYALATTLMNFLDESSQERLRGLASRRLERACQEDGRFLYPVINHGDMMKLMPEDADVAKIYGNPQMTYKHLWNWYERTEPFTGKTFHICYLNLTFLSGGIIKEGSREEIASLKIPLIENDWGVGLTFYYMYLCALATGDFGPIREHWEQLKSVFSFFSLMHDWACMGTGYSDCGILWVEGANYGAFTSFVHFAEAVGDDASRDYGLYLASKQLVLRLAVFRSSQHYFYRYYGVEPWCFSRLLLEESNPSYQFQNYPAVDLTASRFRRDGVYNLSTEGLYPELFESLRRFCPADYSLLVQGVREILVSGVADPSNWCMVQPVNSLLLSEACDESVSDDAFQRDLDLASRQQMLMTRWRGIHIFSRRLPEHWFRCQLLAWRGMHGHGMWLEHWENVVISSAVWSHGRGLVRIRCLGEHGTVQIGYRERPSSILLNGRAVGYHDTRGGGLEVCPEESGTLEFVFG